MVSDVSATLVETTTSRLPSGGGWKTCICFSLGRSEYRGTTCIGTSQPFESSPSSLSNWCSSLSSSSVSSASGSSSPIPSSTSRASSPDPSSTSSASTSAASCAFVLFSHPPLPLQSLGTELGLQLSANSSDLILSGQKDQNAARRQTRVDFGRFLDSLRDVVTDGPPAEMNRYWVLTGLDDDERWRGWEERLVLYKVVRS
ncbi:unnamed protein product [Mycena citricolor]|uniref:Uncharacterized protein n=1 Tax=Mycena citricolor TaxID=2018698 RepID=A0AAD2GSW2_9AGAR|nr:unnamed protein product [Mycena citricolor]CAK5275694.1 unnamed protein product [Mycena citricolor]